MKFGKVKPRLPVINRNHPHARGLFACYPMFEGGGVTVRDVYNRFNGVTTNFPSTCWSNTNEGMSITNSGTTQHILNSNVPMTGTVWTYIIWFKSTGTTGSTVFTHYTDNANNIGIYYNATKLIYTTGGSGGNGSLTGVTVVGNATGMHCFAFTRNGSIFNGYIDGVFDVTRTFDLGTCTPAQLRIGAWVNATDACPGQHLQFRIYKRELSAKEIADIYAHPWDIYYQPKIQLGKSPVSATYPFSLPEFNNQAGWCPGRA